MSGVDLGGSAHSFFRTFLRLAAPYWTQSGQMRPRVLAIALVLVIICQVALAIRLNVWSADLFDALERHASDRALSQIGIFVLIVAALMGVNTIHLLLRRYLQFDWRRWLTARVVGNWMEDARHYQVDLIPGDHANPDGRIAEDIRIATEGAIDLASSLFFCILTLVTFVGILWSLSGTITLAGMALPGHLVILALAYAGAGAVVAFVLGRPLVRATDERQTREADFRFGLVQSRENAEPIALARGECSERGRIGALFEDIMLSWRKQSAGLARLVVLSSGYTTAAGVLPLLVGTPRFLAGTLTLGALMQSAQAFQQVTAALSWPVDNLPRIAEWRASVERVLALDEAVQTVTIEAARSGETAINLNRLPGSQLGFQSLWVAAPDGTAMLLDLDLVVARGEHVLVDGDADATAAFFRVLAGIWPWGRGGIDLPADSEMSAVGRRPFLPEGSLRDALLFSAPAGDFGEGAIGDALGLVGLVGLADRLDEKADWTRTLGAGDLQRLSFARLVLHRPSWIVLGDATDALDAASADAMLLLVAEQLPGSAIIVIGRHPGSAETFNRRMTLQRDPDGTILLNEVYARRKASQTPRRRPLMVVDWLRQGFRV
jgi:vitamin B12/bleomycin/antimicrobial peptide transport system ATP-binding/permease protein